MTGDLLIVGSTDPVGMLSAMMCPSFLVSIFSSPIIYGQNNLELCWQGRADG
jgi:hypothetical protein